MKTCLSLRLAFVVCLALLPGNARADLWDTWTFYSPSGTARAVPPPNETCHFNSLLLENSGGYVAVWDDAANNVALIEQRSAANTQTWQQPLTLAADENTRVVLGSATRVLWCSAQRWVFLDRDTGASLATGTWDQPMLDSQKIIIRGDILHFISDGMAYRYDTNMTALATVTAEPPEGYWASYAGTWLVDLSNRQSHSVRFASIATGEQGEVPLPTDLEGGYTDHRVLSANSDRMFVLSTINWPTTTLHYFTLFNRDGVLSQRRMSSMETITGATALTNGWLLSAQAIGESGPKHYLFRVDLNGAVHAQLGVEPATPQNYIAMNTIPPRLLHVIDAAHLEILDVTTMSGFGWWTGRAFLNPEVQTLKSSTATAPVGSTNYFWTTPICPNNK
jgi:hypothetical protein